MTDGYIRGCPDCGARQSVRLGRGLRRCLGCGRRWKSGDEWGDLRGGPVGRQSQPDRRVRSLRPAERRGRRAA